MFSEVARDHGIDSGLLNRWYREARQEAEGKKAFTGKGKPRDEVLAQLQKENADLKVTNEILKKAVAIFSQPGRNVVLKKIAETVFEKLLARYKLV